MSHMMRTVFVVLSFAACAVGGTAEDDTVFGEVEITRGELVSELSIYLVNDGSSEFKFPTGTKGAGDVVEDGQIAGGGSGVKVIPRLAFQLTDGLRYEGHNIYLTAPIFTSPKRRGMEQQMFVLPAGTRRMYYSFKVPTEYVRGKFEGGFLPRPDLNFKTDNIPGYGARSEMVGAIRITRLIDVTDKNAGGKSVQSR